jgi:hypothetical protein
VCHIRANHLRFWRDWRIWSDGKSITSLSSVWSSEASPTSGTNLPLPKLGFKLFSLRLSLRLCGESHASNFQHALNRTKNT